MEKSASASGPVRSREAWEASVHETQTWSRESEGAGRRIDVKPSPLGFPHSEHGCTPEEVKSARAPLSSSDARHPRVVEAERGAAVPGEILVAEREAAISGEILVGGDGFTEEVEQQSW
mmetsp:Transcript_25324/g.50441  ORF Transcript_25324/g.50441 Transcript_25324/m.50441 type:complete len:119 (-) Transcript_25324:957-1313(-)